MDMSLSRSNLTFGVWCSGIGIALATAYMVTLLAAAFSPAGFPPSGAVATAASIVCLLSAPSILILFVLVYVSADEERKLYGLIGLSFAVIFCGMTCINRMVHLAVVQPSLAAGKGAGLEDFMPYGTTVMSSIEMLGWSFFLGLAFLFTAFAFDKTRSERRLFWLCLVNGILCLFSTLAPLTGIGLFTLLAVPAWGPGFIVFCALLMAMFKGRLSTHQPVLGWAEGG
jgi:hypothetical protein